ncbi:hypothetical protein AAHC03_02001 [Spirometra sp. Aus1]
MSDPTSPEVHWDINDQTLPKVQDFDTFELWPDGHCRMAYAKTSSDSVRRHTSGWAMRNTNNHNSQILKKSCLGVLLCTTPACGIALRPAICDKARRSQEGRPCSRANCGGTVYLRGCRGHGGYPVTHFWREVGGTVFFQAKGHHDHARPDLKPVRRSKTLVRGRKRALARTGPPSASPVTQVTSPAANLEFRFKQCPPLTVDRGTAEAFSGYRTSVPLPIPRSCLQEACGTQNLLNHNNLECAVFVYQHITAIFSSSPTFIDPTTVHILAAFGIDLRGMQQVHSELPCGGLARATDSQKAITSRSLNLTNPDFASHQRPSLVSSTRSYTSTYPNHFNQPPLQDVEAAPACVPPNHRSDSPFVAAGVPPNSRLATAVDLAPLKREHEQTEMADEDSLLQGEDKSPICSHAPVGCEGLAEKRNWLATPSCFPGCYQQGESISTNSGEKNASWSTPSPPTGGSSMLFNVTEMPGGVGPIDEPAVRKLDPDAHRGPDYDVSWMTATGMGISECQWPIRVGSRMNHMSMQSSTPMSADFSHGGLQTRRCESTFAPAGIPFCLESSGSRTSQGSSSNSGSGQLLQQ